MAVKARLAAVGASGVIAAAGSITYLFEGERSATYVDPVGVLTACVGHTGADVRLGKIYTEHQCTELFLQDLRTAEAAVDRCTPGLPMGMKPALVSFTFNIGQGAYCKSTLATLANAGDHVGACQQLYRWVYAGGRVLPGLVKRREAEAASCLEGVL